MKHRGWVPAVVTLVALAAAGATVVEARDHDTIGATIQSRVYMEEGGAMIVWNRSTIAARFVFAPADSWAVQPGEVILEPDEQATVIVSGDGADGAELQVRVMAVASPPPGVSASEIVLTSRVFHKAPFDWAKLAGRVILVATVVMAVLWLLVRIKPWQIRLTRTTR
jgi:hypothetical protein